jgi:hypothetical protein
MPESMPSPLHKGSDKRSGYPVPFFSTEIQNLARIDNGLVTATLPTGIPPGMKANQIKMSCLMTEMLALGVQNEVFAAE